MYFTKSVIVASLLSASLAAAQNPLTASSVSIVGSNNTQDVGGVGSAGDSSCPNLSNLASGTFALCYVNSLSAYALGYPQGVYSPLVRTLDLTSVTSYAQATSATAQDASKSANSAVQTATTALQTATAANQTATQALTAVQALTGAQSAQGSSSSVSTVLDVTLYAGVSLGTGFNTVALTNIVRDTAFGFNRGTSIYTVPSAGYYLCVSKLRFQDNVPSISYGQGVGTNNGDGVSFLWSTTPTPNSGASGYARNGSVNTTVAYFNAGDLVRMSAYVDNNTPLPLIWAELTLAKLGN